MLSQDELASDVGKVDLRPVSHSEHAETFFRQLLGDMDEPIAPFGLLALEENRQEIKQARLEIDPALAGRLRANARRLGVSAASLFHLAWAQVLARSSGSADVVFGAVLYPGVRASATTDRVIEPRVNTLPIRIAIGEEGVEASLLHTHALLEKLQLHGHASLALAQHVSAVSAPTPLFSAVLDYPSLGQDHSTRTLPTRADVQSACEDERTIYPLILRVDDLVEGFRLTAHVSASIGPTRICGFMHTTLTSLVDALETTPSVQIQTLAVLPESERNQVLFDWNNTSTEFPADKCIHELFEEQVRKAPDAIAVVHEDNQLSYAELNRRANTLAHHLRALGLKPDLRVGICAERGLEMVIAMLAVLKAGGAYVPLDPAYPMERLRFMLQDSAPLALLTHGRLARLFSATIEGLPIIHLDAAAAAWHNCPDTNLSCESIGLSPLNLAYVIYTSGSTGTPKGVLCEHRGLCNLAVAQISDFAVEPDSRILQFASFSFDACVSEVMMVLCQGASLYFGPRGKLLVGDTLTEVVAQYGITHVTLPPAVLNGVTDQTEFASLRTLVLAGEAPSDALTSRWARGRRLINAYGPTETTVCATVYQCQGSDSGIPPIGRPIANTRIYILDRRKEPVPIGVAGEIYIGGVGVARGYLNRAELTAQKFVPDPFAAEPGARMYRTGDQGRWRPDGNIDFLGRNDFQVKIRGFRIELGEIESRLAEHPDVREAMVIAREDTPGDKRLVAYYTLADGEDTVGARVDAEALRTHLSARLPDYMAPAAYVRLRSLPLTVNGKLDRKALPVPGADAFASRHYEPPVGEVEIALAEMWVELLKLDRIGRRDNFFELGGHSLLAVRMIARVKASFGARLALFSFIQSPTIAYLADLLSGNPVAHMAVVNKGAPNVVPLIWVAPEPWQPRLTSYLSADQPVLSFVLSQEELASTAPDHKLQDLAACLVKKIRQLYPSDAYVLTGFCQTSLLAYECAQQLRALGYEIPLLVMGDALLPGYLQRLSFIERSKRRLEREVYYLSAFRRSAPSHWKKLLRQRIGGFRAMREQRIWEKYYRSSEKNNRSVQELYEALIVAYLSYDPAPYHGRVLYLQSGDRPQSNRWDAAASWAGLIGELEVFEAPGDHTSIFREPHVSVTAKRLQLALDSLTADVGLSPEYSRQD